MQIRSVKSSTGFCKSTKSVDSKVAHVHVVNGYKIRWFKWSFVSYLWICSCFVVGIFDLVHYVETIFYLP